MRFKGFIGPAYTLDSRNIECQRCLNYFPEMIDTGTAKGQEVAFLRMTPGLRKISNVGTGPLRMTHVDPRGTVLVVSGAEIYKLSYSGISWSSSKLGDLTTTNGPVRCASNMKANGDTTTVIVDGQTNYAYQYISSVESFDDFTALGFEGVPEATHVELIDGFFIFNKSGSNQFYVSDWNDLTVDPLSFASAEGDPDNIGAIISVNRDLWLLNDRSAEIWTNTGNEDFPFQRVSGGFIEKGIVAPYSLAAVDGVAFWLGRDKSGQGIVYAAQGPTPQRISTHAIENAIQGYDIDSVKTADAYTYHDGGHSFYVLNFPEATWVFDLTTKLWHERGYNDSGSLGRHRGSYHAFVPQYGIHIVGDYANNKVYQFDNAYVYDDTSPLVRIRSSPHVAEGMRILFHDELRFDIDTGVGLDGSGDGTDPQVMLDWSDDGGYTWSNEHWAKIGKIGQYKNKVRFRRLGSSYDRVYRLKISDPVKCNLSGAEIDVKVGGR